MFIVTLLKECHILKSSSIYSNPCKAATHFTGFLKVYITVLLLKKYVYNIKNWKKHSTWVLFFSQFYEPLDLGKKISTTWNVLKWEVYLTCINFWKFHDNLKPCVEVIRLPSWPKKVKFSVKMQFFMFLTSWKICFWINDKFEIYFFSKWTWKCSHSPKTNILIKFSNF